MDKSEYIRQKYLAQAPGSNAEKELIAKRYLGNDDVGKKKKKSKTVSGGAKLKKGNIGIVDEDDFGWGKASKMEVEVDPFELPVVVEEGGGGAGKMRSDGWKTVREPEPVPERDENNPFDVDDLEERPQIVGEIPIISPSPPPENHRRSESRSPSALSRQRKNYSRRRSRSRSRSGSLSPTQRISSGAKIGLQTFEETAADMKRLRAEHERALRSLDPEASGRGAQTVHRDQSGRKVDMAARKAEDARLKREAMLKEEKRMEWGKGLVQRQEIEERKMREMEEAARPFTRYADDESLNNEMKQKEMWNDPAASFLTTKKTKGPKKPTYQGPWAPNRFGIPPGYRWDGVDRGIGFEREWFERRNLKVSREKEAYAWASEDM